MAGARGGGAGGGGKCLSVHIHWSPGEAQFAPSLLSLGLPRCSAEGKRHRRPPYTMLSVPSDTFQGQAVGVALLASNRQLPGTVFVALLFTNSAPTPSLPKMAKTMYTAVAGYGKAAPASLRVLLLLSHGFSGVPCQ